jgi:3'(2'), 5'-bisphosphate nucleotidase
LTNNQNGLLLTAINAAIVAGKAIQEIYHSNYTIEHKGDNSPLTAADKRSNAIIEQCLQDTGLPILSEEGRSITFAQRSQWERYWLVDPLDGTKEFIKKNGEFTVNIALMQGHYPIAGVIYVPDKAVLYFGSKWGGSYKCTGITEELADWGCVHDVGIKLPLEKQDKVYRIVGSKSHPSEATQAFIQELEKEKGEVEIVSMGSSLKLCLIAEGAADAYPRFAPTMEWDTAAGQAIVESSEAKVINWNEKERMRYNKENLLNDWFLASRD